MSELDAVRTRYERIVDFDHFRLNISARYRLRSKIHDGADIVVVMKVEPKTSSSDTPCEAVLPGLENADKDCSEALKSDYDASEERMVLLVFFHLLSYMAPSFLETILYTKTQKTLWLIQLCRPWDPFYRAISP